MKRRQSVYIVGNFNVALKPNIVEVIKSLCGVLESLNYTVLNKPTEFTANHVEEMVSSEKFFLALDQASLDDQVTLLTFPDWKDCKESYRIRRSSSNIGVDIQPLRHFLLSQTYVKKVVLKQEDIESDLALITFLMDSKSIIVEWKIARKLIQVLDALSESFSSKGSANLLHKVNALSLMGEDLYVVGKMVLRLAPQKYIN